MSPTHEHNKIVVKISEAAAYSWLQTAFEVSARREGERVKESDE